MRPWPCLLTANLLTASALSELPLPALAVRHRAHCLRCQAHGASLRTTRRLLAGMGGPGLWPPADLEDRVAGAMGLQEGSPPRRDWWPAAATAGLVVALAALLRWRQARSYAGRA